MQEEAKWYTSAALGGELTVIGPDHRELTATAGRAASAYSGAKGTAQYPPKAQANKLRSALEREDMRIDVRWGRPG